MYGLRKEYIKIMSRLSCICASSKSEKNDLWDHLKHLNDVIDLPWCLMGDFNEMLISSDKIRGCPLTVSKTQRLSDFLAYSKGIDANVQGRIFTWKKILRGQLIYEKLDRVIFREECL